MTNNDTTSRAYTPTEEDMLMTYVSARMMRDGETRTSAEQEFRRGIDLVKAEARSGEGYGVAARRIERNHAALQ